MWRLAAFLLASGLLSACTVAIDAEQTRVCRSALPALNPGGVITVERVREGPVPRSLRIDYSVASADRPVLERFAICQFAAEGLSPNKAELTGLGTEEGPLSGASLYLLKRYYLDTPEGMAGDPGSRSAADVAEIPPAAAYWLQQVLVSLPRTAIYALLSVAFALIFGLSGRINLAFGELAAIGSAATIAGASIALGSGATSPLTGLAAGLAAALFAGASHSAVGGYFTIGRITAASSQPSLIATVGLSLFLMEYLRLVQSPVTVWLPPIWSEAWPFARAQDFLVSLTPITAVTTGIGAAAATSLLWLVQTTSFGRAWRAYADDPKAAALLGVNGPRLLIQTLALAGAMAGLSGMLIVAQYGGLGFAGGFQYGLKALIAAIIGGIGSIPGAMLGGFAVGLFETLWSAYLPIELRDMALYGALVVFLIFRPGGLLGFRDPTPRPV
ncbi:branched-subunit amino acid ABC-type transport system permease component [Microvirga flocculans]|uniref:Branched-subunit amino acid ABC-type transport system permease component n=1 Tax=Microvirga flocculans TaxID=217168 RepID=A0A7W6IG80_9HYPH|nr:branched-chain amino acid ABC transporter permease [Microvirga flocculans]MBB4040909.1 branched-subunit amino acid ABC-type transport system permease component [Microvirga flocculans]